MTIPYKTPHAESAATGTAVLKVVPDLIILNLYIACFHHGLHGKDNQCATSPYPFAKTFAGKSINARSTITEESKQDEKACSGYSNREE